MKKTVFFFLTVLFTSGCRVIKDSLYQNTNTYIGAAVTLEKIKDDSSAYRILVTDFNSLTAENAMKMRSILPERGKYQWANAEQYIAFAKQHHMRLHGHTLIWHESIPEWIKQIHDTAELHTVFRDYITTYVSKTREDVLGWDVVNEAIADSGGGFRRSFWYNTLGEPYIAEAFFLANQANPHALLFYNEYGLEENEEKLAATLQMIDRLTRQGVPVHGIGMQMHITIDMDMGKYRKALREFVKRGLMVHLSELDIRVNPDRGKERFKHFNYVAAKLQKDKYYEVVKTYLEEVPRNQQYGITLWGFSDAHSWIIHHLKKNDWPCIYDARMRRKPAYNGMWKALSE